ncbi:hypothetical protein Ddc_22466 [Ditylenchus destructor]|nr:hypothetical protein Ddc_22466 [Ditylenchus destructor]
MYVGYDKQYSSKLQTTDMAVSHIKLEEAKCTLLGAWYNHELRTAPLIVKLQIVLHEWVHWIACSCYKFDNPDNHWNPTFQEIKIQLQRITKLKIYEQSSPDEVAWVAKENEKRDNAP